MIIRSRSDGGAIGVRDWWDGPGCESANIGVSAKDPRYVYGGCYQGLIDELDQQTGLTRDIMPWPEMNLTEPTDKTTLPLQLDGADPRVAARRQGGLSRRQRAVPHHRPRPDAGRRSAGDLTRNDKARQGWGGGPITNEGAGGEVYGTIVVIEESPHDAKTLYVGTDDGVVQRTRDGGTTWTNVTPHWG